MTEVLGSEQLARNGWMTLGKFWKKIIFQPFANLSNHPGPFPERQEHGPEAYGFALLRGPQTSSQVGRFNRGTAVVNHI